jgi:biotin carboxyl carrier protein
MGAHVHEVEVIERLGDLIVHVDGQALDLTYEEADRLGQVILLCEGKSYGMSIEGSEREVHVGLAGYQYALKIEDERERAAQLAERAAGSGAAVVKAVMPGVVVEILVAVGDSVEEGQPLLILEAMKMQNEISAPSSGRVKALHVEIGQALSAGEKLVTLVAGPSEADAGP